MKIKELRDFFSSEFNLNITFGLLGLVVGLCYAHGGGDYWSRKWLADVSAGSVIVLFVGNFILRTLAARNREKTSELTREIHAGTNALNTAEAALRESKKMDVKIKRFKNFMRKESHHNIRILGIGEDKWQFEISPAKDSDGEPLVHEDEGFKSYVIKVNEIASYQFLTDDDLKRYQDSPIRVSEYYFCSFLNGEWHMSDTEGLGLGYPFRFSGKTGRVKNRLHANAFAEKPKFDEQRYKPIAEIVVDSENKRTSGSGTPISIYQEEGGHVFIKYFESLPKKIYFRTKKNTWNASEGDWYLEIEFPDGYAGGKLLENLLGTLKGVIEEKGIQPKKLPWHKVEREMKRIR